LPTKQILMYFCLTKRQVFDSLPFLNIIKKTIVMKHTILQLVAVLFFVACSTTNMLAQNFNPGDPIPLPPIDENLAVIFYKDIQNKATYANDVVNEYLPTPTVPSVIGSNNTEDENPTVQQTVTHAAQAQQTFEMQTGHSTLKRGLTVAKTIKPSCPNPAIEDLILHVPVSYGAYQLILYTTNGQPVAHYPPNNNLQVEGHFDVRHLPPGVYIAHIKGQTQEANLRIVIL
jgi:hypothetical protein